MDLERLNMEAITMIQSIAFFVYPVKDIPRSRAFYEGVLGLKLESNFHEEWLEYDVAGTTFGITTMDMNHVAGAKGGCVAFEVANLDDCVQTLKLRGAQFVAEIMETPVCRLAVVADPDGNAVVIHKRK